MTVIPFRAPERLPLADQLLHLLFEHAEIIRARDDHEVLVMRAAPAFVDLLAEYFGALEDLESADFEANQQQLPDAPRPFPDGLLRKLTPQHQLSLRFIAVEDILKGRQA